MMIIHHFLIFHLLVVGPNPHSNNTLVIKVFVVLVLMSIGDLLLQVKFKTKILQNKFNYDKWIKFNLFLILFIDILFILFYFILFYFIRVMKKQLVMTHYQSNKAPSGPPKPQP